MSAAELEHIPPHLRIIPPHLRRVTIPYKPLAPASQENKPSVPLTSTTSSAPLPLRPAPRSPFPRPISWWVFADTRVTGKIHGIDKDAFYMSNTEVVGRIRTAAINLMVPVVADLKEICPCMLRHGNQGPRCLSSRGFCNSTPKVDEVCFENYKDVSISSMPHYLQWLIPSSAHAGKFTYRRPVKSGMRVGDVIVGAVIMGTTSLIGLCAPTRVASTHIIIWGSELVFLSRAPFGYN